MFEYKAAKLSPHITQITDPTGVFMFVVEGDKEAALIDTGVGFAGVKETVEAVTKLPYRVILTHMHPDHAGGVAAFERAYLHPADWDTAKEQTMDDRLGYVAGIMRGAVLTPENFVPAPAADYQFLPLSDGQVFDLGGISLEIIHVPGHTAGSICVLFREERSILFGDACNINTLLMWGTPISEYKKSLKKLQAYEDRFDTVYYSHGPAPAGPSCTLEDNLELCDRILAGTDDAIPTAFLGIKAFRAAQIAPNFARLDGKYGNIVYTEDVRK